MIPNNELPARLTLQTYNQECAAQKNVLFRTL